MSRLLFPGNPTSLCGNGRLWDHQLGLSCCLSTVLTRKLKPGLWMCLWNWTQPTSLLSESQVTKIKNIQKNRFFSFQVTEMLSSYTIKNISPNILNTNSQHSLRSSLIWKLVKCVDPTHQATVLVFLINSIMKTLQLLLLKKTDIDIAK